MESSQRDGMDQPITANQRIRRVVEQLCGPLEWTLDSGVCRTRSATFPARHTIIECIEELRGVLFPGFYGYREYSSGSIQFHVGATLDRTVHTLEWEVGQAIRFVDGWEYEKEYAKVGDERRIVEEFVDALPEVRRKLVGDAQACFEWDPAAFIPEAPIFCYPNMRAMMDYRLAHELYIRGVPFIPRIITEHAHNQTGIDIHPGAKIGENFFIDHGTGVVIGQTAEIGDRVRLYQGVTLGAIRFPLDEQTRRPIKGIPRHPIVEDDVVIYAESTVLGRITIGRGSVIGANVFLAKSIPPESKVFSAPVRVGQLTREDKRDGAGGG